MNLIPKEDQIKTEIKEKSIQLLSLDNGVVWPYFEKIKAWSCSRLTHFLKKIEYGKIPEHILKAASERGKIFHQIIQDYFQKGIYPNFVDKKEEHYKLNKIEKRIVETINFFRKEKILEIAKFVSNEELHYTFYQDELLAAYSDINFNDFIIELKTSHIKANDNPLLLLIFEIQLLIQHLCSKKTVFLLWSTGEGIFFKKFQKSEELSKILNILIKIAKEEKDMTEIEIREFIRLLLNFYKPKKLIPIT